MKKLLDGVTANTIGEWVRIASSEAPMQVILVTNGLAGATCTFEVRWEGSRVNTLHSTTADEIKLAEIVGNAAGTFAWVEIRAVLSDAQSGTNAEVLLS